MAILLAGDLIIDRTWVVGKPAHEERYAAHYDVLPRNLIEPLRNTDVAGGIGTVARTLGAEGIAAVVYSAWGMDANPGLLIPDAPPAKPVWHRVASPPGLTPVMTRVYQQVSKGLKLVARFDRDSATKLAWHSWPAAKNVRVVVAGDYVSATQASVLELPQVKKELAKHKPAPLLLRSLRRKVVDALDWTILSVNAYHFSAIFGGEPFEGSAVRELDGGCVYHPLLLSTIDEHAKEFLEARPVRFILLNLEKEGALLIDRQKITPILLGDKRPEYQGVGATDVLLAHVAAGLQASPLDLKNLDASRDTLRGICAKAVDRANTFSLHALKLDTVPGWYAASINTTPGKPLVTIKDASDWQAECQASAASQDYKKLRGGKQKVRTHWAQWYLDDYTTVNHGFGASIDRLKKQIHEYLKSGSERPFSAALCGDPGSGKSTLARSIANAVNCDFISENAAQWTSPEDLFWLCERVRTLQLCRKRCLILIDEVDTHVAGQELYGKLLAPLWDGAYFIHGDERTIGSPTIFLLAGSTERWKDEKALMRKVSASPNSKLRDLVSRFTVPPISIPPLKRRQEDVVYLATSILLKHAPRVRWIEAGIFRLLAESGLRHGVRSVTRVVELFKSPKDESVIATSDLSDPSQLKLQIPKPLAKWKTMKTRIEVSR